MKIYIAFLRGINVGGKKNIKMEFVKSIFENLKCEQIQTYLQSGNVVFKSNKNKENDLQYKIEKEILKKTSFNVKVFVFELSDFIKIIFQNPYEKLNTENLYFTFLETMPDAFNIKKINPQDFLPDDFFLIEKTIYIKCISGYGKTKLNNQFFEKKLAVSATTRNWNTCQAIIEIGKSYVLT